MNPGRELDRQVAKIFGWKEWEFSNPGRDGQEAFRYKTLVPPEYDGSDSQRLSMIVPHYSTDIAAAWEAWEWLESHFRSAGYERPCLTEALDDEADRPSVVLRHRDEITETLAIGQTYPHAICLAVLASREAVNEPNK